MRKKGEDHMETEQPKESAGASVEAERQKTIEELELENKRLREEHELLLKEYRASLPLKERMYDRVPLTVRQLDVIIGLLLAALVIVIVMGLVNR